MRTTSRVNKSRQLDERLIYWLRWKKEQTILLQREKNNNSSFLNRLEETPAAVNSTKNFSTGSAFKTLRS